MIDRIDEHRDTKGVGKQDEFLTNVGAGLSDARQEVDAELPFGLRGLDFAHEVVEVADKRLADFAHALIRRARDGANDFVRNGDLIQITHKPIVLLTYTAGPPESHALPRA